MIPNLALSELEATPFRDAETPLRALVVDDDADIRRLICLLLDARGYETKIAASGEQALELMDQELPDLMFLDISMPGMSGLLVLEWVRAQRYDMAVVMTTASDSLDLAIDALRQGADDYLRKPFQTQDFWTVLERTVLRLHLARQNAVLRAQLDEKRRELEAELANAARVQQDLIPHDVPNVPGYEFAACCLPARQVGGDFYDWLRSDSGHWTFALVDVMGKGMPAALLMATTRAALRAVVQDNPPAEAIGYVCNALEDDLERSGGFITLVLARLDAEQNALHYVDAGHGLGFVHRADGSWEWLQKRGLPIGVLPGQSYEEGVAQLERGDALVVYSDGLIDVHPERKLDQAGINAVLRSADSAEAMVEAMLELAGAGGALPDDLTVVVLKRHR